MYMYIYSNKDNIKSIAQKKKKQVTPIQRRMGNQSSEVTQRVRAVNILEQIGGNCGLYCIRMAIESLGGYFTDADYNAAAEASGSKVGEIFSYATMCKITKFLGYNASRHGFKNGVEFMEAISRTSNNPVLIPYSAALLHRFVGKDDTQLGHWSIIENLSGYNITLVNPWGSRHIFSVKDLYGANSDMSSTPKEGKPVFKWHDFMGGEDEMIMPAMGVTTTPTPYELVKEADGMSVTRDTFSKRFPARQQLDLSGYIVEIRN